MVATAVLAVLLAVCGAAVWWSTGAAATGRLPRNNFSGIRLPSTTASEEAWVAAHRAALPWARGIGVMCLLLAAATGVVALTVPAAEAEPIGVALYLAGTVVLLVLLVPAVRAALRAARSV